MSDGNEIDSFGDNDADKQSKKVKGYEELVQSNIPKICANFKNIISNIKLKENLAIFIDGIDVRPEEMSYLEYIECIDGLFSASWNLNNNFLELKKIQRD